MFECRIIRHRPRELSRGGVWQHAFLVALSCAATTFACELVIGDAPPMKGAPGRADGGKSETPIGAGGTTGSGGATTSGGTTADGGGPAQGGASPARDAGTPTDAARDTGDASSGFSRDGGPFGAGGAPPCTTDVYWYADEDGDGFGTSVSTYACPMPAGKWAPFSGDCSDHEPRVHPGQTKYFGDPYKQLDNTDSFDFDCSGSEEPNPQQAIAPADCGLLSLTLCSSTSGYQTNNRGGVGINPWCGSTTVRACIPSTLFCTSSERLNQPPFTCR